MPADELARNMAEVPELRRDWDPKVGDRMVRLCVIGRHMDREAVERGLDACLTTWEGETSAVDGME